ncbi:MAG: M48 family metallopeptidase [Desulfobacterales bacterium]|nr:M48 family metallopeptidase [Desulfobacterales bacterium]MBF0396681.1 M48 family metallopeptidase [Desulfobacterales bacterium]
MNKKLILFLITIIFIFSCQTVPITGRQQLNLIPSNQILGMSFSSYKQFISKNEIIKSTPEAEMVNRAGRRIQRAVEKYFKEQNLMNRLEGYNWEFNLVKDDAVNAWAMPGGKVVVYTGILPIAQNEEGLAVIMGHEVAHAVVGHGSERMSQGLLAELGGVALSTALAEKPSQTRQLFMTAFGIGTQVGILLPYSRLHESEADHLGLVFMAMAGYNPETAVIFWERMAKNKKGGAPPEFLSTHPADERRIREIKSEIPEAIKYKPH